MPGLESSVFTTDLTMPQCCLKSGISMESSSPIKEFSGSIPASTIPHYNMESGRTTESSHSWFKILRHLHKICWQRNSSRRCWLSCWGHTATMQFLTPQPGIYWWQPAECARHWMGMGILIIGKRETFYCSFCNSYYFHLKWRMKMAPYTYGMAYASNV